MDTTIGQHTARSTHGLHYRPMLPWIAAIVAVGLVVGLGLWFLLRPDTPGHESAEAGFARDMAVHHDQAVEMSLIALNRTDDPEIRILATDIMLTQQAQIGQMRGWLDAWGLPPNSSEPQMSWMGHSVEGRMPGMASREEVDRLRELPPAEMDGLFLQLMIVHHQAGVRMAEAVLERSDNATVGFLAEAMVTSQRSEIEIMQDLLVRKGFERVDLEDPMMQPMQHD